MWSRTRGERNKDHCILYHLSNEFIRIVFVCAIFLQVTDKNDDHKNIQSVIVVIIDGGIDR